MSFFHFWFFFQTRKQPFSIYACNFLLCDLIETVTIHPEYNPTTRENNIALLKTYGKLRILPLTVACLPLPYTNLDGEIASMIEVYDLIVQDDETGEEYPAKREKVTNNDPNYNSFKSSFNTQHRSKREPKERQISQELAGRATFITHKLMYIYYFVQINHIYYFKCTPYRRCKNSGNGIFLAVVYTLVALHFFPRSLNSVMNEWREVIE